MKNLLELMYFFVGLLVTLWLGMTLGDGYSMT